MTFAACSSEDAADPAAFGGVPSGHRAAPEVPEAGIASDAAVDASAPPVDPCATKTAACPTTTTTAGSGLVAVDRCAFPIEESAAFGGTPALITALEKIAPHATTAAILGDLNRAATATTTVPGAPPGVSVAFRWATDDDTVTTWIPQGLTGSADASATGLVDGRRVVLVSWYGAPPAGSTYEKGVRLAFVDVTDPQAPTYRFVLLVEPKGTPAAPDFAPITIHAGGIVWFGDLLYVVETGKGFRVFDVSRAMQVATDTDVIGCTPTGCHAGLYKYVVPQVGAYTTASACAPLFSYVSLDRSTSPPSLVSGEYCGGTACKSMPLAGRAYRWPIDAATGHLGKGKSWPSEAFLLGQAQVQGGASRKGTYYLSSSEPAGGGGALYRVTVGKTATSTWLDSPEDLMVDEGSGLLWGLSEAAGSRVVLGAKLASYPAP
jgi:hypothetical protein